MTTILPATQDDAATIGVELAGPEHQTWLGANPNRGPQRAHGQPTIVKRRGGQLAGVWPTTGTVAELDQVASAIAPTWQAEHVPPVLDLPDGNIADGPVPDGELDRVGVSTPLTDELAKVLAKVAASTGGRVEDVDDEAVSVLLTLGLIREFDDGGTEPSLLFVEPTGAEALAQRRAAAEAAERKKVADSYAAVAAELHAMAEAIGSLPTDGLHGLGSVTLEIQPKTVWPRNEDGDLVTVFTVDALTGVLLGKPAVTERLGSSDTWCHEAKGRRGPLNIRVNGYVEDPRARQREQEERQREAELERLRAENLRLREAAGEVSP